METLTVANLKLCVKLIRKDIEQLIFVYNVGVGYLDLPQWQDHLQSITSVQETIIEDLNTQFDKVRRIEARIEQVILNIFIVASSNVNPTF